MNFKENKIIATSVNEEKNNLALKIIPELINSDARLGISGSLIKLNQKFVGTGHRVLIDRIEDGEWVGRTEWDSPDVDNEVRIQTPDDVHLRIGDFAQVRIESATEFDLHGKLA